MQPQHIMPENSEKFDIVLKNLMSAKKQMGSSVKKDSENPFHKSKYASLGAHLDLCESALNDHGLILLQTVNGSYEKSILIATIHHVESGQWIKSYLPLPNPKSDSQGLGASLTYMRRYSISSLLGLNAEDDDGETAAGRGNHHEYKKEQKKIKEQEKDYPKKINQQQLQLINDLEKKLDSECKGKLYNWLLNQHKINSFKDITIELYEKVLITMNNAIKIIEQKKSELVHA